MKHCRFCLVAVLMILGLSLSTCGLAKSWPEQRGRVLEAGSRAPITGAIIVARWKGTRSILVDSQTDCYHVETATTNERGEYVIPAWNEGVKASMIYGDKYVSVTSYKAGYERSQEYYKTQSQKQNVDLLEQFKGVSGERLKYLMRMLSATNCPSAGSSSKNLYSMYKAMFEEAKTVSVTAEDSKTVNVLRQEAAEVAVRPDGQITSEEMEGKVNEFLRNNLR